MRIGVIGVGRIGMLHAGNLAAHPGVESVVLTDVDQARAGQVAADLNLERASDVEELLGKVEAVVIAAGTASHAELIHRAVDAGRPTFCEKPITLDLPSTMQVVEHVRRTGVPLQMGFQRRFDPGYRVANELVAGGALGSLYVVRMVGHDPAPPPEAYIAESGGIFRDFGVHDFDALRFVTGREVVEVFADGSVIDAPTFADYGDVDTAVAILRIDGGALGIMSTTRHDAFGYDIRMEVFGTKDSAVVGWDRRTPLRSLEPGMPTAPEDPYRNFQDRFADAYRAEMSAFIDVAAGTCESACTAEDALEALRVAVACDRSRAEHRPVRLEEIE